jgi:hypothetical protein
VKREDGQVLPLAAILLTMAAIGVSMMLGIVQTALVGESRAQTAADAAALAGAAAGESAARKAASSNGGEVVRWRTEGADALVKVRVGESEAEARARRSR